ncbi:tRNA (adenosine(37)-N6)-dimethylallyltransferase MiaA [Patescibacteria group bacterium]|nr:tRNA (adenosine(37)-N6)-dimethylallyltransferase MiaA [Patescibacteria group bacterium]
MTLEYTRRMPTTATRPQSQRLQRGEIKPPLVAIVGPTATGKSEIAIDLAEEFNGEIVSADSRQVYRGMDIGTGKVLPDQQGRVPHHLLDVADPNDTYTVVQYKDAAIAAIQDIQQRGLLPFLVGGTGLYIQAVIDNLLIPPVPPQPKLRAELDKLSKEDLVKRLKLVEPVDWATIDLQNPRRIIRAIEVSETAGIPISEMRRKGPQLFDTLIVGIDRPKKTLDERIERRMMERFKRGFIEEVRTLHSEGVSWERLETMGLEYRRIAEYLQGKYPYEQAVELCKQDLIQFAKRQYTWFRSNRKVDWVDSDDEAQRLVSDWLVKRTEGRVR